MTACTIHYRLDGPGPAAFIVECEGRLRLYTRGMLGGSVPRARLLAVLAERGCRWIPATGTIDLELEPDDAGAKTGLRWHAPIADAPGGATSAF